MIVYDKNNKEINLTENPNLLVNADFKSGIINQKSTHYEGITKSQYTIDRWILDPKGKDTSLYIQNGRVEIYQDGTGQDFDIRQFIYALNSNEKYHLHFRYNDKDYDCDLIANENSYNVAINDDIDVLLSKKDSKYLLAINFRNQQSNFIEYIKLERGSYFTGMPVWNKAVEELKCSVFYRKITGNYFTASTTKILNIMCSFYPYMNKNPEIAKFSASHENGTIFNLTIKSKGLNHDGVWWLSFNEDLPKNTNIRWSIELDANDY